MPASDRAARVDQHRRARQPGLHDDNGKTLHQRRLHEDGSGGVGVVFVLAIDKTKVENRLVPARGDVGGQGADEHQPEAARAAAFGPVPQEVLQEQRRVLACVFAAGVEDEGPLQSVRAAKTPGVGAPAGVDPLAEDERVAAGEVVERGGKLALGRHVEGDGPHALESSADRLHPGVALVVQAGDEHAFGRVDQRAENGGGEEVGDEKEGPLLRVRRQVLEQRRTVHHVGEEIVLLVLAQGFSGHDPGVEQVEPAAVAPRRPEAHHADSLLAALAARKRVVVPVRAEASEACGEHRDLHPGRRQALGGAPGLGLGPPGDLLAVPGRDEAGAGAPAGRRHHYLRPTTA